jgi:PAS domain S-box-containing protein
MIRAIGGLHEQDDALGRSEERYLKMMEGIPEYVILILDKEGIILNGNSGIEKMKGYDTPEIIGKDFRIFFKKEDQKSKIPEELLKEATKNGSALFEGWRKRKDDTYFWCNVTLIALHNKMNQVDGFLEITKDLTVQRNADDNLNLVVEELARRNVELRKSEERYHQMIDEVEDYAIILLDPEGMILHWNKGAERIKGYKPNEAIGKRFTIFYTEEDNKNGLPDSLLNEARSKGRVSGEGWRLRKDGKKFWATVVITALHNDQGAVIGFSKVTRDLTKKKLAEDELNASAKLLELRTLELQASEERYHQMIDEVQDYAIILLDKDGRIQNWNRGAEKIKGYSLQEIIGKSFTIFYEKEDRVRGLPQQLLQEAVTTGRATHEGWRVRKDGTKFWGSVVITSLHDKNSKLIGFSKVTRDLTEKKLAEETLKQYTQKLERNNLELEQFAYVASHDLKEPLRKIITFGNLLEGSAQDVLDEKARDYIARMQNSATRMMNLIEDLLAFSRVNRPTEGFELVDLNAVVNRVLSDLEVMIHSKNAKIVVADLPPVEGRKSQLGQLFQNLISNAVKFNDKPEPVVTITAEESIEPLTSTRLIKIEVIDNGIGFENIYSARIFEIFQRLHGKTEYPGTGIGLSICKKIVEAHGGTISATGQPGQGAKFTLMLPLPF